MSGRANDELPRPGAPPLPLGSSFGGGSGSGSGSGGSDPPRLSVASEEDLPVGAGRASHRGGSRILLLIEHLSAWLRKKIKSILILYVYTYNSLTPGARGEARPGVSLPALIQQTQQLTLNPPKPVAILI